MTPATAILVPVLNRPHRVAPLVENIEENTPEPHRTMFVVNESDFAERDAIQAYYLEHGDYANEQEYAPTLDWLTVGGHCETWAQKINAAFRSTPEPFVFLAADDLNFHPGWLAAARRVMESPCQDDDHGNIAYPGVVGTNDLCNPRTMNGTHSTHMLVRRSYIEQVGGVIDQPPGVVLNEAYPHDYVDDEFHETARFRGVYAHAFDCHVEHLHPLCGKGEMDETYQRGLDIGPAEGRRIYESRCSLWGGGLPRRLRKARTRRG